MNLAGFVTRSVALPAGLACAAAALLAQVGQFSGHLDVLTHFAPLYLLGGTIVLALAPLDRRPRRLALIGASAALASFALMAPELLSAVKTSAQPSAPPPAHAVKLVQFNAGRDSHNLEARIRWLRQEDPDVLVVEDSRPVFQTMVVERLGRRQSCGMTCEISIFTREAPLKIESPRRGRIGLGPAVAVAHLQGPAGPYAVVGTHYAWPTAVTIHRENGRRMQEILKPLPARTTILMGDFNSTPWSFARRRDDRAFGLERRTRALPTWPANGMFGLAFLPIDHVYAGAGWRTVSVTRGPRLGSDHYPVVVTLAPR